MHGGETERGEARSHRARSGRHHARFGRLRRVSAVVVAATLAAAACDSLLQVEDPTVVTPDQLSGPTAVSAALNGIVRSFQEGYDSYIRYSVLISDEMIASGTITDRVQVDDRRIRATNPTLVDELYEPLQTARQWATDNVALFQENLDDPEFAAVRDQMELGIVLGELYRGYLSLLSAELYCRSVLESQGPALSSAEAAEAALATLGRAETAAASLELEAERRAALVGQARALVWLGRHAEAAALVSGEVPDDFAYLVEYSANSPGQNNELMQYTWGVLQTIRWNIGDGTSAERQNERWEHFDEWVAQGLIQEDPPGLASDNAAIPVNVQHLYTSQESDIVLASGWEARMIEAENELRNGDPQVAEDRVNELLTDPSQAANPMLAVNPELTSPRAGGAVPAMGAFDPVTFTGDLATDLPALSRAREAGLWLSGQRQADSRRFLEGDGVDLYPERVGDEVCLPIPTQEVEDNPNL